VTADDATSEAEVSSPEGALLPSFGCRCGRVVGRDNTVQLGPRLIAIPPGSHHRSFARCLEELAGAPPLARLREGCREWPS
jgi:hypothetical protein